MAENETSLIKTTYLDALVVLQREKDLKKAELKKIERAEKQARKMTKKSEINKKIVSLYLKEKFPDAFQELGTSALSEKEFPKILKRAKRYFCLCLLGVIGVSSALLGGEIALLAYLLSLSFVFLSFLAVASIALTLIAESILTTICIGALRKGEYYLDSAENNRSTPSLGGDF